MNPQIARRFLLGILALSFLLSLLFAARVPFGDNPDETAHYDYIKLLVQERGFVRFIPHGELPEGAPSRDEAHQPPLYYLLCVPVYAATGGSVLALRLVALALQLATVAVAYRACRDLFPTRPEIAVGTSAFVAFLPTQAQLGGAINNDPLSTLLCLLTFWQLGRLVLQGQDTRGMAILGLLFGLGLWTKLSVVQLVPVILVAYAVAVQAGKLTLPRAAVLCAGALALGVVLASPWLIRNTLLYGDPLTLGIYTKTGPNFTPAMMMERMHWTQADYLRIVGVRSFATFWYFINPNVINGPVAPLAVVVLLSIVTWLALYSAGKKGWLTGDAGRVVLVFLLGVLLLVPFFTRFVLTVFQAQGRYFLPVLLPVAVLTALAFAGAPRTSGPAKPGSPLGVLWVPTVLLCLALYQLMGGGFVPVPGP